MDVVRGRTTRAALWAACCLACLLAPGCRTDPAITALERENRNLEDQVYALQDLLDQTQDRLETCQRDSARLKKGAESPESSVTRPPERIPLPTPRGPDLSLPKVELPAEPLPSRKAPEPPRGASPPKTSAVPHSGRGRAAESILSDAARPGEPKPLVVSGTVRPIRPAVEVAQDSGVSPTAATALARGDNRQVRRITLHRELTGGWNRDDQPGDDGIRVAIEPRDTQGKPVAAAGRVAVVVIDAAVAGEAARMARWDLSAEEMAGSYRKTPAVEGFCLNLPWPGSPPVHRNLQVFVRYVTDDGRKLEAHLPIQVALPGEPSQRWSAASPRLVPEATQEEPPAEEQAEQTAAAEDVPAPAVPVAPEAKPPRRPTWTPDRR